jgi:hypothetical protein
MGFFDFIKKEVVKEQSYNDSPCDDCKHIFEQDKYGPCPYLGKGGCAEIRSWGRQQGFRQD